jgi:hypothetical protein
MRRTGMKRAPTDREILEAIYVRYYPKYKEVSSGEDVQASDSRIYLPVDLASVAAELKVDGNIVFGRLLYYLDPKYAYQTKADGSGREGAWVHLFWLRFDAPQGKHWVNFPVLASVLASLQEEHSRVNWTRIIAIGSLAISAVALALSVVTAFWPAGSKGNVPGDPRRPKTEVDAVMAR